MEVANSSGSTDELLKVYLFTHQILLYQGQTLQMKIQLKRLIRYRLVGAELIVLYDTEDGPQEFHQSQVDVFIDKT
jgi:hypothetical protein